MSELLNYLSIYLQTYTRLNVENHLKSASDQAYSPFIFSVWYISLKKFALNLSGRPKVIFYHF